MVLAPVDESGVDPERGVVEKEPVARPRHVDAPLDPVVERGQRRDRVVAVESEIAREVVSRPEGDADERHVLLDRDLRDGGERAVAAGHSEHVGTRVTRELREIVAVLEEPDLDTARAGSIAKLVRGRRVRAGTWVDDQVLAHRVGSSRPER